MKYYDVMGIGEHCYSTYMADRHQIDQHNNLHLMDENYEDILVLKNWIWFRVKKEPVG